jgi:hypothetical protein
MKSIAGQFCLENVLASYGINSELLGSSQHTTCCLSLHTHLVALDFIMNFLQVILGQPKQHLGCTQTARPQTTV